MGMQPTVYTPPLFTNFGAPLSSSTDKLDASTFLLPAYPPTSSGKSMDRAILKKKDVPHGSSTVVISTGSVSSRGSRNNEQNSSRRNSSISTLCDSSRIQRFNSIGSQSKIYLERYSGVDSIFIFL